VLLEDCTGIYFVTGMKSNLLLETKDLLPLVRKRGAGGRRRIYMELKNKCKMSEP